MNNENDDMNWMPKTSKKTLIILAVCSPILALFSWNLLIYFALASD